MAKFNGTSSSDLDCTQVADKMNSDLEKLREFNAKQEKEFREETESTFPTINAAVDAHRKQEANEVVYTISMKGPSEDVSEILAAEDDRADAIADKMLSVAMKIAALSVALFIASLVATFFTFAFSR